MHLSRSTLIKALAVVVLTLPTLAFGQNRLVSCNGLDCTWCSMVQMIQNLINFAIFLGTMCAALLFMWAGFLYITNGGSTENISKAKRIFKAIVIGFVAILGGWLAVDTIMKALVGGQGSSFGPWNDFRCATVSGDVSNPVGIRGNRTGIVGVDDPYSDVRTNKSGETSMSTKGGSGGVFSPDDHDGMDARSYLTENGISFSRGACTGSEGTSDNCISMAGVRRYIIEQMVVVKETCGDTCSVVIDRGSEPIERERGTYTHVTGYVLDILRNDDIDAFFIDVLTKGAETIYSDSCSNEYVQLAEVWRITVWNKCSL